MTEGGLFMNAVVAVGRNWGIGKNGGLLFRIPEDMRRFRRLTEGKTVVMGRKTLESLPNGKPLKNRRNVVLSSALKDGDGFETCGSEDELFEKIAGIPDEEVFVIGGETVYRLLLPYCRKAYVTRIEAEKPSDVFFPNLDGNADWIQTESEVCRPEAPESPVCRFEVYENRRPKKRPARPRT